MRKIFERLNIWLLALLIFGALTASAQAATAYGVTFNNQLVRFDTLTPGSVTTVGAITGLQPGENIVGIDFRPATGQLYALGSTSRLYTINLANGAATAVSANPLSTALNGTDFAFDFNPTVDRIRVVSDTGQNLRVNPNDATVTVDTPINPVPQTITAAAYTNNFAGATATMLFYINSERNTLMLSSNPNGGVVADVGPLGIDASGLNGFDFESGTNSAFAVFFTGGVSTLFRINLATGAATPVGPIGGNQILRGFAVQVGSIPNVGGQPLNIFGLTTNNQIVRFTSANIGTIASTVTITGLIANESIVGIDFRPATGQLYALSNLSRLFVINPMTGAATQVGAGGAFTLQGNNFGFDFNPVVDRIRVVSDTGQNLRLNPNDGTLTATDTPLNPGTPSIVGAAYTNNFNNAPSTTLYDIDSETDRLLIQNPPNGGTLVDVGGLGVNTTANVGFDISTANQTQTAIAAFQIQGESVSKLFSINLMTGAATFLGQVGGGTGVLLRGIAIQTTSAPTTTRTRFDYDGDNRADFVVFRPSNNTYYVQRSTTGTFFGVQFGSAATDIPTPGDFDGDGRFDFAVFRTSGANGIFFILNSSNNAVQAIQFGLPSDEPVVRDYDGDGRADLAVVRRQGGQLFWYILNSSNGVLRSEQFGLAGDVVAPGDYDGDGRSDLAVRRGTGGNAATFFIQQSSQGFRSVQFGFGSDVIVPGDYDGDGRTDIAVVRQGTNYVWSILQSSTNTVRTVQWGAKPHLTAQADYDGDGRTDVAVYDPGNNIFYVLRSSNNTALIQQFGSPGDVPVAFYDSY